jgi:hypothetical protein
LELKFHGKTFRTSADLAQAPKGEWLPIWLTEDGDSLSLPDAVAKFKCIILFCTWGPAFYPSVVFECWFNMFQDTMLKCSSLCTWH